MKDYIYHLITNKYFSWRTNKRKNDLNKMISEVKLIVKEILRFCELNKQNIKYNSLKALGIKDNILQRKSDLTDSLQKREKRMLNSLRKLNHY